MKAIIFSVAFLAVSVLSGCGCKHTNGADLSWRAYCVAYGVKADAPTVEQENYFLDCWCGSVEEEQALSSNE